MSEGVAGKVVRAGRLHGREHCYCSSWLSGEGVSIFVFRRDAPLPLPLPFPLPSRLPLHTGIPLLTLSTTWARDESVCGSETRGSGRGGGGGSSVRREAEGGEGTWSHVSGQAKRCKHRAWGAAPGVMGVEVLVLKGNKCV